MAEESVDGREHEEACARIIAKLGRLKHRDAPGDGSGEGGAVETKSAGARLAFIRAALMRCAVIQRALQARPS